MSRFKYYAFNETGDVVKNYIVEDDIELAKEKLIIRNYEIIRINKAFSFDEISFVQELKDEKLANFCGQIAIILDSGVTILRGIDILVEQTENKQYKSILQNILKGVKKGQNLSVAMENTKAFPSLLTDMIGSGEVSGELTHILFSMENFYTREAAIKARIKSAAIYPVILLFASVLMVLFFNFFVFNELKTLFDGIDELPFITSVLIGSLNYLNAYPLRVFAVIIGIIASFMGLLKIEKISLWIDQLNLRIPLIGRVRMDIITSRITSSMAIFIRSAVPLVKVLTVIELLAANKHIGNKIASAKEEIVRGENIADAFERCKVFDPMMIQMIRVGEETGKLEDMLFRVAEIYEKKSEVGITRLVSLIEPVFTLVVGVVVGFIIIAMALPIFQMSSMFTG